MISKKAAMFGLEGESLKKQSGELFLARLQRLTFRLVEGHQATRSLNSKAAMFGLDARIALAIFGALATITSVSLLNSVSSAKMTNFYQQLVDIEKGLDSHYVHTSVILPPHPTNPEQYELASLIENVASLNKWKGPYVAGEVFDDYRFDINSLYGDLAVWAFKCDNSFGGETDTGCVLCSDTSTSCSVYLKINNVTAEADLTNDYENFTKLDEKFDGGDGNAAGKLRATLDEFGKYRLWFRTIPIK